MWFWHEELQNLTFNLEFLLSRFLLLLEIRLERPECASLQANKEKKNLFKLKKLPACGVLQEWVAGFINFQLMCRKVKLDMMAVRNHEMTWLQCLSKVLITLGKQFLRTQQSSAFSCRVPFDKSASANLLTVFLLICHHGELNLQACSTWFLANWVTCFLYMLGVSSFFNCLDTGTAWGLWRDTSWHNIRYFLVKYTHIFTISLINIFLYTTLDHGAYVNWNIIISYLYLACNQRKHCQAVAKFGHLSLYATVVVKPIVLACFAKHLTLFCVKVVDSWPRRGLFQWALWSGASHS